MLYFLLILGVVEGLSTLALVFVAMPLKYYFGVPAAVYVMGSIHGYLFILYLYTLFSTAYLVRLPQRFVWGGFLAALLPFGPFVLDRSLIKWKRKLQEV